MVVKTKGFLLGATAGVALTGAAVAGATVGYKAAEPRAVTTDGRPQLIRAQNITPALIRPPAGAPLSFADIIERVSPAVVSIEVTGRAPRSAARRLPPGLEEFFGLTPRGGEGLDPDEGEGGEGERTLASGSGFFISADGYIVTNNHVVENAREITVHLSDERELQARVLGRDEETDLAVLKVEGRNFPFVTFANNVRPRVGDWVIAIGNPFQLNGTATAGIVSAVGREIDTTGYVGFLQIDAPINRGNSGGPTFDLQGRVIGVNTAIYSPSGASAGVGFAIPADTADQITRQLISGRAIARGYLGVSLLPESVFDEDAAESVGLRSRQGAFVQGVTAGGPAARAGVRPGDVVLRFNGQPVPDSNTLTRLVAGAREGQTVRLDVWRGGRTQSIDVVSGRRPSIAQLRQRGRSARSPAVAPGGAARPSGPPILGMRLSELDADARRRLNVDGVRVDSVDPESDAADKAVERGLLITRVGDREVRAVADVQAAVEAARRGGRRNVLVWFRPPGSASSTPVAIALQPNAG